MPNKTNSSKPAAKKERSKKPTTSSGKAEKKPSKGAHHPETEMENESLEASMEKTEAASIDLEELEEQEDAAAAESSNSSGNAAALAAATGTQTEMSASFKNFRHHPDMENFYRFIFENDLRHEALAIIDEIMAEKHQRRLGKGSKAQAH